MNALTGISLWIALVTVVPGLVTVTTVFGAFQVVRPEILQQYARSPDQISVWVWTAIVVTIMVLTQAAGILLEEFLVRCRLLGRTFTVDNGKETQRRYCVYHEFGTLYFLLAQLRSDEDAQGHLQRTIAQFFLTNNTLISFVVGIVVTLILLLDEGDVSAAGSPDWLYYVLVLLFFLGLSYIVAVIRFREMAKSIWAAKKARAEARAAASDSPQPAE